MAAETDRARLRPGAAIAASLLLHAALLFPPIGGAPRRTVIPEPPTRAALTMTLRPPSAGDAARASSDRTHTTLPATTPAPLHPVGRPARPAPPARIAGAPVVESPARPAEPRDAPARTALDPDALHAQIRDAARQGARASSVTGFPAPANSAASGAATLLDRPVLDALARRVGRPLQVTHEQRLADGGWRIRFAGGVCIHVPRELPVALDTTFGANVALTTNCSD